MNAAQHDEALKRNHLMWRWTALVPSFTVFFVWTYLWVARAEARPVDLLLMLGVVGDPGMVPWLVLLVIPFLHSLFVLSPMLAWAVARRRKHRRRAPAAASADLYRVAPLQHRSWWVSGPFPWWAAAMFLVSLLLDFRGGDWPPSFVYPVGIVLSWPCALLLHQAYEPCIDVIGALFRGPAGIAHACLFYLWWTRYRRDASRAGVIEQVTEEDGTPGFVLRTLGDARPVRILAVDRKSREIRLFRAREREVWQAVEPVDDLDDIVRHDTTRAAV